MKKFYTKSIASRVLAGSLIVGGGMLISLSSIAQPYMNNNGAKLNIASGTFLNIDGTFENQTSGANHGQIENNGTMEVFANWTNNATSGGVFSTNTGTVILDGSGAQTIGGTNTTLFNNLTLSSVNGTGATTMGVNTTVGGGTLPGSGVLSLGTRTLILGTADDYDLTVNNPNSTAITTTTGQIRSENQADITNSGIPGLGYSYVNWNIGTSGSGSTYVVPFGTASGTDIKFTYDKTSAGTGSGAMKFATYPTLDDNTPWATTVNHMNNDYNQPSHLYVIDRFWIIEHQGYTTPPTSRYIFKYDDADIVGNPGIDNESQLRPQRFNPYYQNISGSFGAWGDWLYGPDNINTVSNTLQITIANGFNGGSSGGDYLPIWTLVDESNPLPIELIRFVGACNDGQVEVSWTTASETNNDYFTVQRSLDGISFEDVTIIDGAGNSNSIINYAAIDYSPYGGTSYYRLKQTDFDGNSKHSDLVAVSCADAITDFNLVNAYDQDNGTMAVIFNAGDNELYTITLFDARGRQITQTTGKAYSGKNQVSIPVGDLARGIYLVNLSNEFKSFGRRVMLH